MCAFLQICLWNHMSLTAAVWHVEKSRCFWLKTVETISFCSRPVDVRLLKINEGDVSVDKKRRLLGKRKKTGGHRERRGWSWQSPGAGKRAELNLQGVGHGVNAKPGWDLSLAGVRICGDSCDDKPEQLCPPFKVVAKTKATYLWLGPQQSH